MSNILVRTITGAFFITSILFPLFVSKELAVSVFGLYMLLGIIEFYQLFKQSDSIEISWKYGAFMGLLLYGISVLVLFEGLPIASYLLVPALLFLSILWEIWRNKKNPLLNVSVHLFGIIYLVVPFSLMAHLHTYDTNSFPLIAGMFLLIWMNDTFAYLSGRFFGRTKLFERISPKKTWEGTIGGGIFTLLAGFAIALIFDDQHLYFWVISALLIAPCSVFGDLIESLFKRNMNVKDSGNLLPGHGGILDRFDATLFTVPFFVVWTVIYMYF